MKLVWDLVHLWLFIDFKSCVLGLTTKFLYTITALVGCVSDEVKKATIIRKLTDFVWL